MDACQKSFDAMKALLAKDAFLRYPDHNKRFDIFCDVSCLQLGSAIMLEGVPVAFYCRKLNAAQTHYTTGEKELLSIVQTLKTFRTMLYGCPNIHVDTDHKNNTFHLLQTQRVLRWRLLLEDYGVHFKYIKGETNSLADALSRLPFDERQNPPQDSTLYKASSIDTTSDQFDQFFSCALDDDDLIDCFVHLPVAENIQFVLDYRTIANAQPGDVQLQRLRQAKPECFIQQLLAPDANLWCYLSEPNKPWKIYFPDSLLDRAICWYHYALGHIGQSRLLDTMSMTFYNSQMRRRIEAVITRCLEYNMSNADMVKLLREKLDYFHGGK